MDYKSSGVDIKAGEQAVSEIKGIVKMSHNKNVLTELGSFGGLYNLDLNLWKQPILVSSTDGVGTKILIAKKANKFDTIGRDLVNHCVNDIFVQGAIPQFFLDYIGISNLNIDFVKNIIEGMTTACIENELALIGGEMAEMPDIYQKDDFDLVGTIVGLVEKSNLITGQDIIEGDVIIGLPSAGLHTNGYTLVREIVFNKLNLNLDTHIKDIDSTLQDALLEIHKSYFPLLKKWANPTMIHGMAHITGGGLKGNIKRIIPNHLTAHIDTNSWDIPSLFRWLMEKGNISITNAFDAWNMGIGFVVITSYQNSLEILKEINGIIIGKIEKAQFSENVFLDFSFK